VPFPRGAVPEADSFAPKKPRIRCEVHSGATWRIRLNSTIRHRRRCGLVSDYFEPFTHRPVWSGFDDLKHIVSCRSYDVEEELRHCRALAAYAYIALTTCEWSPPTAALLSALLVRKHALLDRLSAEAGRELPNLKWGVIVATTYD